MISKVQEFLIREVCELQTKSLDEVFCWTDLGEERENLLAQYGAKRSDFDKCLLETRRQFEELKANPENLEVLNGDSLSVFLFILSFLRDKYEDQYPNALRNLGRKVIQLLELSPN